MGKSSDNFESSPAGNYISPTPLADAIQYPLHPVEKWQSRVLNGYIQEAKYRRRRALSHPHGEEE